MSGQGPSTRALCMPANRAMPHLLQMAPWTEGCKKVIPGARVCSVLTQKGTAWAGLLLGPLDISTIAGQCMVGCLRMIMVHIIGGLSVGVLEDAREVAMFCSALNNTLGIGLCLQSKATCSHGRCAPNTASRR